jgi:hypothetical protein
MNNYNFDKYIYKRGVDYYIELNLPQNFKSFIYKIYGDEGYYNFGKFTSYKNSGNNTFIISIDKPQMIFIVLTLNKDTYEFFDFINMVSELDENSIDIKKNIKLNIKRKDNIEKEDIDNLINNEESDEDSDEEDSDEDSNEESESDNESDKKSNIIALIE